MFGVLDLVTVLIIEDKLKFYSQNVEFIEQILYGYHNKRMFDMVGPIYVKESIEYIQNQKITVAPYYNPDSKKLPQISIIASGEETQQYVGDYGYANKSDKQTISTNPIIVDKWTAVAISGDIMQVPKELKLDEKLWPGVIITNGVYSTKLVGVIDSGNLCLRDALPDNLSPNGWMAVTAGSNRVCEMNSSTDSVTVQCKLTTVGEAGQHRLIGLVLRSILKSSRLQFDYYGFQNTKISWSPMVLTDQDTMEFESVYTISGLYTDHWIQRIAQTNDSASNIQIGITAVHPDEEKGDVNL